MKERKGLSKLKKGNYRTFSQLCRKKIKDCNEISGKPNISFYINFRIIILSS